MNAMSSSANSLSGRIFSSVLVFTLCVVVVLSVVLTSIYYFSYEHDDEAKLLALAQDAAVCLNDTPSGESVSTLEQQFAGSVRYTLIDNSGVVLFDSVANTKIMESHAYRPEVLEAGEVGTGTVSRYSETLKTDTLYAAVRLEDGSIVRLSETRESLLAFLGSMLLPVTIALLVVVLLVFLLSQTLTRRIMKPIDALNFVDPLQNDIYEEMNPLLERIDDQQRLLKQQNDELAHAENLRRDFSSNVSHEMKTPLQVISGYAELMKNDMVKPADRQRFAELIYLEAQTMRSLINDVLTLSRLDETAFDPETASLVDLYAVAERVVQRLAAFAESQKVAVHLRGGSFCSLGSETLLEEMLYNLTENAIRYNHEGGHVMIDISEEKENTGGKLLVWVVMCVSDTGSGIPTDMQDKVFERFFRVEKSRSKETGGTGLGLAIAKHAVLYHKGTIQVDSVEGQGTTFVVKLPAAEVVER